MSMIDLETKEKEVLAAFDRAKAAVESHTAAAQEATQELVRLQGEYRLIQELKNANNPRDIPEEMIIEEVKETT